MLTQLKYRFGDFEIDCAKRQLSHSGAPVQLKPKTFELLQCLVENHGKLISKSELMNRVWPDQFVEENNLTVQISALRKVFGEQSGAGKFIATVPGKGYSFVADISEFGDTDELVIEHRSISRITIEEHRPSVDENLNDLTGDRSQVERHKAISGLRVLAFSAVAVFMLLAVLGFVFLRQGSSSNAGVYELTKLTTSGDVTSMTITPDGENAIFARKETDGESLWLRRIATGNQQQILNAKPVRFVGIAVSPDGASIYATTFSPNLPDPQIWQLPLLGGQVNVISEVTTGAAVSFSPDGKKIAYTESRSSKKQTQLLTSNADGSDKKIIARADDIERSFPNFNANPVAWSPDGKVIAATISEKSKGSKHQIVAIDPVTGSEKLITSQQWDLIENLAWIDNENLAFVGYKLDPWLGQVWSVSRTTGEVTRITNDLSSYSWMAFAGGKLLTVQRNAVSRVAVADLDADLSIVGKREIFVDSGGIDNVEFDGDGGLLYSSNASNRSEIWRMNIDGTNAKQFTTDANATLGLSVSRQDGAIVFGAVENGKYILKLVDADGRNPRLLTDGPDDLNPEFTADGRSVIFQKGLNNLTITLWRLDLADNKQTQITQNSSIQPAVSPDGTQFAYYFMDQDQDGLWKIGIISALDGTLVKKLEFPRPVSERQMRWLADGSAIAQIFTEGDKINLVTIPVGNDGSRIIRDLGRGETQSFAFSRDGRRLAISFADPRQDVILLSR